MIRKDCIRRTKSLSDIDTAILTQPQYVSSQSDSVSSWQSWEQGSDLDSVGSAIGSQEDIPEDNGGFQHSKSCGNLLSLYENMHPLLYKAVFPLHKVRHN